MHGKQSGVGRLTMLGLTSIGLLLIAVVGWGLYDLRRAVWSHAATVSSNLVTALGRDIGRTFATYDLSLLATAKALQLPALGTLDEATRHQLLFDGAIEAEGLGSMFVMDAEGRIVHDSGATPPRAGSFADRDYFTEQRDHPGLGLFISRPYRSRLAGDWSVALSRRVDGPDGRFAGIVVGSIRFGYFARLFANLDVGTRGSISLTSSDGRFVYRTPFDDALVGRDVRANRLFHESAAVFAGQFSATSQVDGRERLFTFTHVGELPLVLSVNVATQAVYAQWRLKASVAGGATLVLLLTGAVLLHVVRVQARRRAAAEGAASRVASLFEAYFLGAPDALFLVSVGPDAALRYERLNPACEELTGLASAQASGQGPRALFDLPMALELEARYLGCAATGEPCSYDVTRVLPGGRRDWHTALSPIRDADGAVTLILGSARDMTESNRQGAERLQSAKMEAVGRLTAGVAHDFNNYLQTVVSSLELLAAEHLHGAEAQGLAAIAHKAATSGATVTHRLLAFSRQQVLQPRRVNVAALMGDTRKLAANSLRPDIHVKIAVEPFTSDVVADPVHAESCLLNLLRNAAEAMPQGGSLVLHARNARPQDVLFGQLAPGAHVVLAVHDTGCGMDEATRARAFEPFFTTKAFGNGAGLGLSMAQGFCQQSGGDIRLLSGGPVGTRVELWLPAASADMLAGEETSFNLATIGRGTGRILMVEDEPDVATALSATLVSGGFEVVAVTSGAEGLLRLRDRDPYDAVLSDYAMPDMTGVAFLVRAARLAPGMPTLLLTGYDLAEVTDLPDVRLLRKPIRRTALLNAVREAIGDHNARAATAELQAARP